VNPVDPEPPVGPRQSWWAPATNARNSWRVPAIGPDVGWSGPSGGPDADWHVPTSLGARTWQVPAASRPGRWRGTSEASDLPDRAPAGRDRATTQATWCAPTGRPPTSSVDTRAKLVAPVRTHGCVVQHLEDLADRLRALRFQELARVLERKLSPESHTETTPFRDEPAPEPTYETGDRPPVPSEPLPRRKRQTTTTPEASSPPPTPVPEPTTSTERSLADDPITPADAVGLAATDDTAGPGGYVPEPHVSDKSVLSASDDTVAPTAAEPATYVPEPPPMPEPRPEPEPQAQAREPRRRRGLRRRLAPGVGVVRGTEHGDREAFLAEARRQVDQLGDTGEDQPDPQVPEPDYANLDPTDLRGTFRRAVEAAGGVCHHVVGDLPDSLLDLLVAELDAWEIVVSADEEVRELAARLANRGVEVTPATPDRAVVAGMGVTSAMAGIAATGSLVLDSRRDKGRLAALLPPVHLCVLPVERLVATPSDVLRTLGHRAGPLSSSLMLLTGPSHTSDVERLLTVGAHGPSALHVVILERPTEV
jgi:L-lactate utilization protein LutC